jgi:hypothetical protein
MEFVNVFTPAKWNSYNPFLRQFFELLFYRLRNQVRIYCISMTNDIYLKGIISDVVHILNLLNPMHFATWLYFCL